MSFKKKTITKIDSKYVQQYDAYIERQKRKKQRLVRRLVLFSLIVIIAIGSLSSYHIKQHALKSEKKEQYEQLEQKLVSLKEEEESYLEEVSLLNDEDYVLEIARTNYFFSKKGELIFKIFDEDVSY